MGEGLCVVLLCQATVQPCVGHICVVPVMDVMAVMPVESCLACMCHSCHARDVPAVRVVPVMDVVLWYHLSVCRPQAPGRLFVGQ